MEKKAAVRQRPGGRPGAQASKALDQHILSTAIRLFIEQGYAGTSIEQIAAAAGAGKQSIYRRYPSKEDLFEAVVSELRQQLLSSVAVAERSAVDPLTTLREVCRATLELLCTSEAVSVYRILFAEAQRFPVLIEHAVVDTVDPFEESIARLIKAAAESGQISRRCADETAARALLGLITGWALRQRLLGRTSLANEAERMEFFESAWTIFLRGVVTPPD